jgi:hypothetical protein
MVVQMSASAYPFFRQGTWANGTWTWANVSGSLLNLEGRTFIEYDTVDLRVNPLNGSQDGLFVTTLSGPNRPGSRGPNLSNVDLYRRLLVAAGGTYAGGTVAAFDPNGDNVVLAMAMQISGQFIRGTYILRHADNNVFKITEALDGAADDIVLRGLTWSNSGEYFVGSYEPNNTLVDRSSLYRRAQMTGTGPSLLPDVVTPDRYIFDASEAMNATDKFLYSEETDLDHFSNCLPVKRMFPSLAVAGEVGPIGNLSCRNWTFNLFPNSRASGVTASGSSYLVQRGPHGSDTLRVRAGSRRFN